MNDYPDGIVATLQSILESLGALEHRLDRQFGGGEKDRPIAPDCKASKFPVVSEGIQGGHRDVEFEHSRAQRPPLPDPRLVRRIIRTRQLRNRFFDGDLFQDPAWDMLLDLTAARAEHQRVSVTSLCIASGVPPTTALRWIGIMEKAGIFQRIDDPQDRRRAFIALTEKGSNLMAQYFSLVHGIGEYLI